MKKFLTLAFVVFTISVFTTTAIYAQSGRDIGKIFTKSEADQLFGAVTKQVPLSYADLLKALLSPGNVLQFGIKENNAVITNEKRELLSSFKSRIGSNEQLAVFSKNMLRQFLSASKWMGRSSNPSKYGSVNAEPALTIEIRASGVTTISAGDAVLEFSSVCPPFCPEGF